MTLQEVKDLLDAEVLVDLDRMDLEVKEAGSADLMSDVLFLGKAGMLLVTGLTNPHVVHTAYTLGIAAIVIVRGKRPPEETIRLAVELQIPMMSTRYILFETVGRLYARGIVAVMEKVGKA